MTLPPWWKHAADALTAARDRDYPAAAHAAHDLQATYGPGVLPNVMLAWIDTVIAQRRMDPAGKPVRIVWQHEDTDTLTDADHTPSGAVWAGRLIGARLADDEPMFRALLASCAPEDWSAHVSALLTTCGAMLREVTT